MLPSWPPSAARDVCTPGLLALHRSLTQAGAPLQRALTDEWPAHWEAMQRCMAVLAESVPRWRKMMQADACRARTEQKAEEEVAALRVRSTAANIHAADDADFFSAPQPLPSNDSPTDGDEHLRARALAPVGILACLPGHVAKLASMQQRKVEIAHKLLTDTHHELVSHFAQLGPLFDAVHDAYALHKAQFTPAQLALWTSAASLGPGQSLPTGGKQPGVTSGHKKVREPKSGSKSSASDAPPANSVVNIMLQVEQLERIVNAQYDSHLLAWSQLQRALQTAATPVDAAAAFEISRGEVAGSVSDAVADSSSPLSPSAVLAWLHLPLEDVLESWHARHDDAASRSYIDECLQLMAGRTPRFLTSSRLWADDGEEEEDAASVSSDATGT